MSNNATIEIIYTILKNCEKYKSDANCKECTKNGTTQCNGCQWHYIPQEKGGRIIWGVDYLLGQIIRQIDVPAERKHLSVGAKEKWKELGFDEKDIWKYNYQDWVSCNTSVTVIKYKGASKNGVEVSVAKNGGFTFREVFHDEHIVPINDILEELFKMPKEQLTHEIISEYLDKIHICRILKSEDRKIRPKYKRGCELDYKKIYEKYYVTKGVIIPDFKF